MYKVLCTEVTFSENRWEDVILRFDIIKEDKSGKEHIVRKEEVSLPFYTIEEVKDRKTGEVKIRRHSCMTKGDFNRGFRHAITTKAMLHFFPGDMDIFLRMTDIALKICGTHELVECATPDEFLDYVYHLSRLREEALRQNAKKDGKCMVRTLYAWSLYRSIIEVFDGWAKEVKIAEEEEEEENEENEENDE